MHYRFPLLLLFIAKFSTAQVDTATLKILPSVFQRLTTELSNFKPDTSAVPNDKLTQKIIELRTLRGGFNVNEAIAFKIEEDRQKGDLSPEKANQLTAFFTNGNGKRWLDNAVIHVYRNRFSYNELKQLVKFYKTSAGQKMADDFPVIMLQTMAAAQMLKDEFEKSAKQTNPSQ